MLNKLKQKDVFVCGYTYWSVAELAFGRLLGGGISSRSGCWGGGGEWGPPTKEEMRAAAAGIVVIVAVAVGLGVGIAVIDSGRWGYVDPLPLPFPHRAVEHCGCH